MGKRSWTHLLAFVVGMVLTISVYESRRLFRNASRAVTVAQSQLAGEPVQPEKVEQRRESLIDKVEDNPDGARRLALQLAKHARDADGGVEGARQRRLEERRARIRAALAKLSPEQLEALKRRRAERRQRLGLAPGAGGPGGPQPDRERSADPTRDTALPE